MASPMSSPTDMWFPDASNYLFLSGANRTNGELTPQWFQPHSDRFLCGHVSLLLKIHHPKIHHVRRTGFTLLLTWAVSPRWLFATPCRALSLWPAHAFASSSPSGVALSLSACPLSWRQGCLPMAKSDWSRCCDSVTASMGLRPHPCPWPGALPQPIFPLLSSLFLIVVPCLYHLHHSKDNTQVKVSTKPGLPAPLPSPRSPQAAGSPSLSIAAVPRRAACISARSSFFSPASPQCWSPLSSACMNAWKMLCRTPWPRAQPSPRRSGPSDKVFENHLNPGDTQLYQWSRKSHDAC